MKRKFVILLGTIGVIAVLGVISHNMTAIMDAITGPTS